jgi:hypothetical protein
MKNTTMELNVLNTAEVLSVVQNENTDNGLIAGKGQIAFSCAKIEQLQDSVLEIKAFLPFKLHMKDAVPYLNPAVLNAYKAITSKDLKANIKTVKAGMITQRSENLQKLFKSHGLSILEQRIATNMALGKESAKVELLREIVLEIRTVKNEDGTFTCSGVINQYITDHLGVRGALQYDTVLFPNMNTKKTVMVKDEMFDNDTISKALGKAGVECLKKELTTFNDVSKQYSGNYKQTFEVFESAMKQSYEKSVQKLNTLASWYK